MPTKRILPLVAFAAALAFSYESPLAQSIDATETIAFPAPVSEHAADTKALITLLDHNAELKKLLTQSIEHAHSINPDPETNPVQSLDDYFAFIDWASRAMPFNILPSAERYPRLYESIDQSLDYFYFLVDQPLDALKDKGYYYNSLQYVEPFRSWMIAFIKRWGIFLSAPESWNQDLYKRAFLDPRFGLNNGWYEPPENWASFNDFFSRRLSSPAARPIADPLDDAVVVSPADAVPQGVWPIDENSRIVLREGVQLKSAKFDSVASILGPNSAYTEAFAGGVLTHTFLDVNDYHRYHFPVSGTIVEVRTILADDAVGGITLWNKDLRKYVLESIHPGWQSIETRACVIVDTGKYGLVAILPIGMSQVSSVNFEENVSVGTIIQKGDPLGYFLFGGSDIVMIFQNRANFELVAPQTDDQTFQHLLMGEAIGRMHGAE